MWADILNEWDVVNMVWVPSNSGIVGNEGADKVAKRYRNSRLNDHRRWKDGDYQVGTKKRIDGSGMEEWVDRHDKDGHDYYVRQPSPLRSMRSL